MVKNTPKTAMEKALVEQLKTSNFSTSVGESQSRRCYYTSIPRVVKQKGIHGQELTSMNLDKVRTNPHLLKNNRPQQVFFCGLALADFGFEFLH
jgi:A1 cistron-splicing factor AAR2